MKRAINYHPKWSTGLVLAALPFVLLIAVYVSAAGFRPSGGVENKLLPSLHAFGNAIERFAFKPDRFSGEWVFWVDTFVSLKRIIVGLFSATILSVVFGLPIGFLPILRRMLGPFFDVLSLIPPLAILPILFIIFGLGETSKIMLIILGVTPFLVRDVALAVGAIPREQIIKAQTLGASTWQMLIHVVFPQILPRLLDSIRLSLGATWLFLIAAEAIASEAGLGYRIFLVRRYLAMDVILPYVVWITLLAYLMDYALVLTTRIACGWHQIGKAAP